MFRSALRPAAILAAVATTAPLQAQGWIEMERPPNRIAPIGGITRVGSRVSVSVEGRVARVEVEERFRNNGAALAEGSYLYPLPGEAVFQNFSLWAGAQELKGEVMTAEQARGIYDEIVRRRRDPALLTLAGHGLVRAQVFPIAPGEVRKVVLRYTHLLDRAGNALRLRYASGDRGPAEESPTFRIGVADAARFGSPFSPTHPVTSRRSAGRLDVQVDASAGGDVEVFLPLNGETVGTSVVAHASAAEGGHYMLLLSPPPIAPAAAVPRDVTLVVDISGSMSGTKLEQAKAGLTQALGTLAPADRFRVIAFSSAVRSFRESFVAAAPDNVTAARTFVEALQADGGTNIQGALDAALDTPAAEGRLGMVVFMTDGLPSVGEQAPDHLADEAARRSRGTRIFTVGVGHDVNTYLLDRLAAEGHGSAEYVSPNASVETAVGGLLGKMRYPALINLRVVSAPVRLEDSSPGTLPDLFYGEELVVLGRYQGEGEGALVIEGERNGHRERFTAEARFPRNEPSNEFVPRLWASRRIGDLTRQIRLEGASGALVDQVRDLGLRYGILTEYSSYLVQEPVPVAVQGVRREFIGPASAPAAQSGRVAFEAASRSAQLSRATNIAAADKAAAPSGSGDAQPDVRQAGGRVFARRDGVWTDQSLRDMMKLTTVAPFSPAYFALMRALPELRPCAGIGEQVVVAGRRMSVKFAAGGATVWRAGELESLIANFRGT